MGEALRKTNHTREEYLAAEEKAEYKSEFHDGEIFAMAGGSRNHSVICLNMNWAIREAIMDKDCTGFDSNMKLDIPIADSFVYPDMMVVCGDIEFSEDRTDIIRNPVLIIEVLSPGTQVFDRGRKFEYYRSIPSVCEYVMVSQDKPMVECYHKKDEKNWSYMVASHTDETILLRSLGYELSLEHIYQKVDWTRTDS